MSIQAQLKAITDILLDKNTSPIQLTEALKQYKTLLLELSNLDLETMENKQDIHTDSGIAIGTTWAAMCLDDIYRTQQFIRGLFKVVNDLIPATNTPIHVLYAGTGPFATLILPLLSNHTEQEVQVTLLEINKNSIENVKHVINQLGFQNHIKDIVCEDATKYEIKTKVDIILSETMQHALLRELQVPIMLNLVGQTNGDSIMIPKEILLSLAFLDSRINLDPKEKSLPYNKTEPILSFDKAWIKSHLSKGVRNDHLVDKTISLQKLKAKNHTQLAILTDIRITDGITIDYNQSGLTIPYILKSALKMESDKINLKYKLKPMPMFEYEMR